MQEIEIKISELLELNGTNPKGWENFEVHMELQDEKIEKLKALAKAKNTLLGRVVRFPHADSYAVYVVTKLNTRTVQLTWVKYCDAWVDSRVGAKGNVSISFVQNKLDGEDRWEEYCDKQQVKKERN